MRINCLIIDDEPLAQDLLESYINKIPFINLVAKCSSALEALDLLRNHSIDLIFLDIHMPNISGIDFIKSIETRPLFIFTTAYSEYAIEAFDLNAVDYLVKPIPFDRFLKATNKVVDYHNIKNKTALSEQPAPKPAIKPDYLFVKADYKEKKVNYKDILYIEGLKDYIKIHLKNKQPLVTHKSLKSMLETLEGMGFVRIHRSFIISIQHIKSITKNRVVINEDWIPIGDNYKEAFLRQIKE
ncbi:LytR/AlgR family response regulator transcription factor [Saccharicrinis aurantiacus]|uniref:LytR/AlgR family response regulator transcription factor n=1 Tax=Saccharicrinis aurantiacus TaxID=1849719 RepID=UPI002491C18A|nr:LytTR family DNA-binding domain-containing protein [Saccharicrinis aurantiacus]